MIPPRRPLAALVLAALVAAPVRAAAPAAARVEAAAWAVAIDPPTAWCPGKQARASIALEARDGHHVNLEYPTAFRPDGASTAAFASDRIPLVAGSRRPCPGRPGETCAVVLDLPFTARAGPTVRLAGLVAFSVCSADRCLIEKIPLSVEAASTARCAKP